MKPSLLFARADRLLGRLRNRLRLLRLRLTGAHIAGDARCYGRFVCIGDPSLLSIGRRCSINEGVMFNLRAAIAVGDDVHLSPHVQLHTGRLEVESRVHTQAPIRLGNRVWLAAGVVVSAGVSIGEGTIVGANAVVLKDLPAGVLAGGVPARVIRRLGDAADA